MNALVRGFVAGCVATIPMTVAMELLHRRLPFWERYSLPPRQITQSVANKVGLRGKLSEPVLELATGVAHFGYGAAVGVPFALTVAPGAKRSLAKGAAYGVGIWAASYLQVLPTMDLLQPATRHPQRRNLLMIAAHIIWGITLASVSRALPPDAVETH